MELQVVTFEQAKALKEMGFPQEIRINGTYYTNEGIKTNEHHSEDDIVAPSLEEVAMWIRKEYYTYIMIEPLPNPSDKFELQFILNMYMLIVVDSRGWIKSKIDLTEYGYCFNTYDEALSIGIDKIIDMFNCK